MQNSGHDNDVIDLSVPQSKMLQLTSSSRRFKVKDISLMDNSYKYVFGDHHDRPEVTQHHFQSNSSLPGDGLLGT